MGKRGAAETVVGKGRYVAEVPLLRIKVESVPLRKVKRVPDPGRCMVGVESLAIAFHTGSTSGRSFGTQPFGPEWAHMTTLVLVDFSKDRAGFRRLPGHQAWPPVPKTVVPWLLWVARQGAPPCLVAHSQRDVNPRSAIQCDLRMLGCHAKPNSAMPQKGQSRHLAI